MISLEPANCFMAGTNETASRNRERCDRIDRICCGAHFSSSYPAMTKARSPRPECGRAEQRLLRRGLRAPILRRRFALAAQFGGGVPAPARVVEHAAGERDHVGFT